jgi:predicted helicase
MDARRVSLKETNYVAPLWLYHDDNSRTPNFNVDELKKLCANLSDKPSPEDMLSYIYAALYSPIYRSKYSELLKSDFPRIPIPNNDEEYNRLVPLGRKLRDLHLMQQVGSGEYPLMGEGTGVVERVNFSNQNVYINSSQYFAGVPEIAWSFHIGGYLPAQRWLKDRKGRTLDYQNIEHYQRMIQILVETDRIMNQIG